MKPPSNADEMRARIVKVAYELFQHYGYAKTTVADIARACGMSAAYVYRFFPSKAAINEAICDLVISELEGGLHLIAAANSPASMRLAQLVEYIALFTAEKYSKDGKAYDMVTVAIEEHWEAIQRHIRVTQGIFADVIASGVETGEFKPQDSGRAARAVCFAIVGFWHPLVAAQCQSLPETPTPAEMTEMLLSALEKPRPEAGNTDGEKTRL